MSEYYWSTPLSSTVVSRQKQFDELTNVQLVIETKPEPNVQNPNESAMFHVFKKSNESVKLTEALKTSLVEIKFLNLTSELKTIVCTQREAFIPERSRSKPSPSTDAKKTVLGGDGDLTKILKVYAIDRKAWRSIRIDSIISWRIHSTLST